MYFYIQVMAGTFVIHYENQVLEPTGEFQVGEPEDADEVGFPWWGILIICVGSLLIILVIVIILVSCA